MDPITTDGVPPRERLDFWPTSSPAGQPDADRGRRTASPSAAGSNRVPSGGWPVSAVSGQGIHAAHGRAEVARTDRHFHVACVHVGGEARITHRGEELCLRHGDVFLTDSRRQFALGLERPWRHLVAALPTHWLEAA
jgi:hypothetical protein